MKKVTCLIMVLLLTVSMASCGAKKEKNETETETTTVTVPKNEVTEATMGVDAAWSEIAGNGQISETGISDNNGEDTSETMEDVNEIEETQKEEEVTENGKADEQMGWNDLPAVNMEDLGGIS